MAFVQDAGDTLHTQANALDSAFVFDVTRNYGAPNAPGGVLGAKVPRLFWDASWHLFSTDQHGDNVTYEITPKQG